MKTQPRIETWFIITVSLCLIRSIWRIKNPGPSFISSIILQLTHSPLNFQPLLINLKGQSSLLLSVFNPSSSSAAILSPTKSSPKTELPPPSPPLPTWRLYRRSLATEVMHPSRIKSYSWARKRVLHDLIGRLQDHKEADRNGIKVIDRFHYAMFCLLVVMCFGGKVDEPEHRINEIAMVQHRFLLLIESGRFSVFSLFPRLGKILFRNRWKELLQIRNDQEQTLLPLIKSRIESVETVPENERIVAYVDTLKNLNLPDKEMVSMCGEFLNAGTDTTATALQWIMANLVKYPDIQRKLYADIVAVVGPPPGVDTELVVNEDELEKMTYLKAVVLEGLRRHPPAHLVLPHNVTKNTEVQGYAIPRGATINFMVAVGIQRSGMIRWSLTQRGGFR